MPGGEKSQRSAIEDASHASKSILIQKQLEVVKDNAQCREAAERVELLQAYCAFLSGSLLLSR